MISRCSRECLASVVANDSDIVTSVKCRARAIARGCAEESDSSHIAYSTDNCPPIWQHLRTHVLKRRGCSYCSVSANHPVNARTENLKCPWLPIAWRRRSVRCRSALAIFWRCRSNRMTLTLLSKSPAVIFLSGRLKMVIALDQPTNVIKLPVSCS